MASLTIAWGVLALIAYLGVIYKIIQAIKAAAPSWEGTGEIDPGLVNLAAGSVGAGYESVARAAITAIPIAIGAIIVFGIILRIKPTLIAFSGLLIVAATVGLIGSLLYFYTLVVNPKHGMELAVALGTIVVVSILLRLQRFIRRFYKRTPAIASFVLVFVVLSYLILGNGTNITSIVLSQVDIWLSMIAFSVVLYASINSLRHGQRLARGK